MFCSKCGNKLNDEMGFCPQCGTAVHQSLDRVTTITIVRNKALAYAVITFTIRVDKKLVYKIKNGETINIPLGAGKHTLEISQNASEFCDPYEIEFPEINKLIVSINKLTGQVTFCKESQKIETIKKSGIKFDEIKSKFMDAASNAVNSVYTAASTVAENASNASKPVELSIPEGGVNEPEGYDLLGTHIEIAATTSVNALDAKRPYSIVLIDGVYPYAIKDGQKINIPVLKGHHHIELLSRGSKRGIDVEVKDVLYLKIITLVSLAVVVSRDFLLSDSKADMNGLYNESINANSWNEGIAYTVQNCGITKTTVGVIYSDKIIILNENGDITDIPLYNQYLLIKESEKKYILNAVNRRTTEIDLPLTNEMVRFLEENICRVNEKNQEYLKRKADDAEAARIAATFDKKFGIDEKILVSEKLNKIKLIQKHSKYDKTFSISEVIDVEAHEIAPIHQDTLSSAMVGKMIAGTSGAYLAASHARDVNNSLLRYEVWITRKHNGDIEVEKVLFGDSKFDKGSNTHQKYIAEFKRLKTYIESQQTSCSS